MAQLIASVLAHTRDQVLRDAARAAMLGADWLELRLDTWPADEDLTPVFAAVRLPVLVACRTPEDGGGYRGTLGERRELLTQALAAGAQGIDLEQWETWSPPVGHTGLKLRVRSFHSFTGVPRELRQLRDELSSPGTVAKIVVTAHDLADAAPVFELLQGTDQTRQPTVAFALGRTAWPTRVMSAAMGSPFVYGSLGENEATAPSQPSIAQLGGLYRIGQLGPGTTWYGLLGNPALHSLGPWLHNRAFRRLGIDGVYLPLETSRPDAVLAMLPRERLGGVSVTAPHKQRLLDACDVASEEAVAVGAVNTLVFGADASGEPRCTGHNTDVLGVRAALQEAGAGRDAPGAAAVVLGAGGAARAGAFALRQLGYEVTMLARSHDAVRAWTEQHSIRVGSLSESVLERLAPRVLINATPVGSVDRAPEERLVPEYTPAEGTIVHDMVYRPHRTRLLRDAERAGCATVPGVEMFLAQAQAQVHLFTGESVSHDVLRAFLAGSGVGSGLTS